MQLRPRYRVDDRLQPWEHALRDFRCLDITAAVHGSYATGLAREGSDLDVLTSRPLSKLVDDLNRPDTPLGFTIVEHVPKAKIPRLILHHEATGIEVDVICTSADLGAAQRDAVFRLLLHHDPRARALALHIGDWVRDHAQFLPPRTGFPNSYTFRIIGFHYLMVRSGGPLLPPLACDGIGFDVMHSTSAPESASAVAAEDLFREWLGRLATSDVQGLRVDLRNPWAASFGGWFVTDPVSGHNLTQFRGTQPSTIAHLARETLLSQHTS